MQLKLRYFFLNIKWALNQYVNKYFKKKLFLLNHIYKNVPKSL